MEVAVTPLYPISHDAIITGTVPGSPPAESYDQRTTAEHVDEYLSDHPQQSYFFRVRGWSMKGAGIYDGDVVTVDPMLTAGSGDIVLARVDGDRYTLKRYMVGTTEAYLISDSGSCREQITAEKEIQILGVVSAVSRRIRR